MNQECPRCKRKALSTSNSGHTYCTVCRWEGPECYGKQCDATSPKCAGGADPTYWKEGTHVRPPCAHFTHCRLIPQTKDPMQPPLRPWQTVQVQGTVAPSQPQQVPQPPMHLQQQLIPQQNMRVQQAQLPLVRPPTGMTVPTQYGNPLAPGGVPQNYQMPGAQVPGYLAVPEPEGTGLLQVLLNSVLRSALKGAFHTAANLMDHIPWGSYPDPPQQG